MSPKYCWTSFLETSTIDLLDVVAAARYLDTTPWPSAQEIALCHRIWNCCPAPTGVTYICDHLPIDSALVHRAVESYVYFNIVCL